MLKSRIVRILAILLLVCLVAGCSEELPPETTLPTETTQPTTATTQPTTAPTQPPEPELPYCDDGTRKWYYTPMSDHRQMVDDILARMAEAEETRFTVTDTFTSSSAILSAIRSKEYGVMEKLLPGVTVEVPHDEAARNYMVYYVTYQDAAESEATRHGVLLEFAWRRHLGIWELVAVRDDGSWTPEDIQEPGEILLTVDPEDVDYDLNQYPESVAQSYLYMAYKYLDAGFGAGSRICSYSQEATQEALKELSGSDLAREASFSDSYLQKHFQVVRGTFGVSISNTLLYRYDSCNKNYTADIWMVQDEQTGSWSVWRVENIIQNPVSVMPEVLRDSYTPGDTPEATAISYVLESEKKLGVANCSIISAKCNEQQTEICILLDVGPVLDMPQTPEAEYLRNHYKRVDVVFASSYPQELQFKYGPGGEYYWALDLYQDPETGLWYIAKDNWAYYDYDSAASPRMPQVYKDQFTPADTPEASVKSFLENQGKRRKALSAAEPEILYDEADTKADIAEKADTITALTCGFTGEYLNSHFRVYAASCPMTFDPENPWGPSRDIKYRLEMVQDPETGLWHIWQAKELWDEN